MNLSPMVAELAATYEQEHGCKPADLVLQIVEHILKVGETLCERGKKEAQRGETACTAGTFIELAQYAFHNNLDAETAQAIGDLWYSDYMDGYTSATGVQ